MSDTSNSKRTAPAWILILSLIASVALVVSDVSDLATNKHIGGWHALKTIVGLLFFVYCGAKAGLELNNRTTQRK